ncbi:FIG00870880: hypothetical protein [uncultured Leptolyngbya sp.]|uniref:Uncharacterized protein n=1 Tax=uncultured Leptolyngbya sp. TaxID=332963 RepID=A0A6J4LMZ4_9CYAN|nr:FIG00870880: hypothetical protein [uncultured Leptolyngbya sp.]
MKTQWECFLENLGTWHGSFARLSVQGELVKETSSILVLEQRQEKQVRFSLKRDSSEFQDMEFDLTGSFSSGLLFFENGGFCQGSTQFSPHAEFGAEFGFIHGDRRLRFVQMYNAGQLSGLTLIREQRAGSGAPERPPLQVEDLIGEWQGEALTIYPDLRTPTTCATKLSIRREDNRLYPELRWGQGDEERVSASSAQINGSILQFDQGAMPIQILLLPDGVSSNCPLSVKPGHPFFLEVGWLLQPNLRQRMVRSYTAKGEWSSITLVTEQKRVVLSDYGTGVE